ncbi:ATP-dependent DNA ligase [Streptomyces sp. B-S-A8]|uniref:ATP-dependent DNA ligase n=1 Tax=Streptomyces solicavernae TaxID=3043614 RepID=A0ABT6RP06_9ACTN|nr:ATP-dependent DNA ligase [Streptomyces sp. B-S-A8]MDI3385989.1 ATP-dependent DNA ligase [Streptomyces sp. B-S-A8]
MTPPPARPPAPPVRVALAESVAELPTEGPWAYEPKFDGHRLVLFRGAGPRGVLLQARSGRTVTAAFPDLAEAARALPEGTVVDGEVVVWTQGRIDFAAVQRRAAATPGRAPELARTLPASYAAFDLLAEAGADLRARAYGERRERLLALLAPLGPPLQPVPMTTDPELAALWYESLRATGVEGLVIKRLDQPYPSGRRAWLKLRHSDTRDAVVVGFTGSPARPQALVLVLPGDDDPLLSSPLAPAVRARAAELLPAPDGEAGMNAIGFGDITYRTVPAELTAEVRQQATRHRTAAVVRFRSPEP